MKKVLPALVLISLLAAPVMGLAAEGDEPTQLPDTKITTMGGLVGLVKTIGAWIFTALLAVAAIFLVVAGFMWVTAGGNVEQTTKARQMLINALIGLAIALGTRGLIAIIEGLLGTGGVAG